MSDYLDMNDEEFENQTPDEELEGSAVEASEPDEGTEQPQEANQQPSVTSELLDSNNINYEEFYNAVMSPIKDRDPALIPRNIDEVTTLINRGYDSISNADLYLNSRRTTEFLADNGITSDESLAYALDLLKGNKQALKKLIKEHNINVSELSDDSSMYDDDESGSKGTVEYKPETVNTLTTKDIVFRDAYKNLLKDDKGKELANTILNNFDSVSKQVIYDEPRLIQFLMNCKNSGIYDKIVDEMNREATFNSNLASQPFIHRFKEVGDKLYGEANFVGLNQSNQNPNVHFGTRPKVINNVSRATRTIAPKSISSPSGSMSNIDPLDMDDATFLKYYKKKFNR